MFNPDKTTQPVNKISKIYKLAYYDSENAQSIILYDKFYLYANSYKVWTVWHSLDF